MDDDNDNKIFQEESSDEHDFEYNFISIPWDDRTTTSKVGIISLLVAIFAATMACVLHNIVTHFGTAPTVRSLSSEINCNLVKVDQYKFAARIHSSSTQELLCVGAVVSPSSVVANGVCVKAGPIRLQLGSPKDPRCKKGFSVDIVDPIYHEGTVSKHLVLLMSNENMAECVEAIKIGNILDWNSSAYIIGRPLRGGRSLSRQPTKLAHVEESGSAASQKNHSTLCVKELGKCPVRAGDLLVQHNRLFGLASTSTHFTEQSKVVCFADLRSVFQELKGRDSQITTSP